MRLTSVTVRNYRAHRAATIDFDPHRTLIGGPNETGKSTMIEAIHRALFLRAKSSGEARTAMLSSNHGGNPEVELEFDLGAKRFTLIKR
ncbi:MAG: ATP-binding protein, partial [Chthoniobacteraceae bacterium]